MKKWDENTGRRKDGRFDPGGGGGSGDATPGCIQKFAVMALVVLVLVMAWFA